MHDPKKLPVKIWAEKSGGRTRIMVHVEGEEVVEAFSWPNGYDKLKVRAEPVVIPLSDPTFMQQ